MLLRFITGLAKIIVFCCFLVALAAFSGIATMRYIFATSNVEIPDLVGTEIVYAIDLLSERHLNLKIVEQQLDPKIPKDHILAQDPPPGTLTKKNRTVRVVVSKGAEVTNIPDVIGKRWQVAKQILSQHKFRVGNVAYAHSTEVPIDCVVAQTPLPYSEANPGTAVDLLVSLGPHRKIMVMPDLVEEHLSYALDVIEKLGLVLSKVEHDEQYTGVPPNTVLSQVPKPGTLVEEQNIVTFVVSGPGEQRYIPQDNTSPVQYKTVGYTVPPGRSDREVAVFVRNDEGTSEMYHQYVPPGNQIVVHVPMIGETVIEIYLDGTLDEIRRIN